MRIIGIAALIALPPAIAAALLALGLYGSLVWVYLSIAAMLLTLVCWVIAVILIVVTRSSRDGRAAP